MNSEKEAYWSRTCIEALAQVGSSLHGLTDQQVRDRLAAARECELVDSRPSQLAQLVAQFKSPIVILLLATAILSFALNDATNGLIVLAIVGLSGALGYWQEASAANAVARLLSTIETRVIVRRQGETVSLSRRELVAGDIILLKAGSVVPADCRLVECNGLLVDESALTGESFPVEKQVAPIPAMTALAQRTNCLFLGTHVSSGSGTAMVMRIGKDTEFGKISNRLDTRSASTDFERGLRRFGSLLVVLTTILVAAVFLANIAFARPVIESLLFALALAVGMTPQLLPAVTSVVLASGAQLMARSEVIVKRLIVIENFGSMDTLCMDKTGTLTSGTVELHKAVNVLGESDQAILRLAWLNASLQASFENPIDAAILRAAREQGVSDGEAVRKDELPYDFQRKLLTVLVQKGNVRTIVTKGAYRSVLGACSHARIGTADQPLHAARALLDAQFQPMESIGVTVFWRSPHARRTMSFWLSPMSAN